MDDRGPEARIQPMSGLLYLYGFVPDHVAPPPEGLFGVGGAPVRQLAAGGVHAIVAEVPAAEYSAEALEARMQDLSWLGDQGALHERVVTWCVDHGGILPARLLTLYASERSLSAAIEPRAADIREELARLEGLREWDLKVSYKAEELRRGIGAVSEAVAELDREIAGADPGRRYLLDRKRDKLLETETGRVARRLGNEVVDRLAAAVRDVRRIAGPTDRDDLPVVVHAALLVAEAREPELQELAQEESRRLAGQGMSIALSGPWAPYRFIAGEGADG
jgi:hypothetical protein